MSVEVLSPGMLTTFQDLGRHGLTSQGFTESGALDVAAYKRACILTGNEPGAPALEFFYTGPKLRFDQEACACVTGAPFGVKVNGQAVGTERLFHVPAGATVTITPCPKGAVGYLQVAGDGFTVTSVEGSCSTTVQYGIGGVNGRALRAHDVLPLGTCSVIPKHGVGFSPRRAQQRYQLQSAARTVRVICGPHFDRFDEASRQAFVSQPYTVTPQSNRMGARLAGTALTSPQGTDITSEGVVAGTIQINGEGQPMIMLADHQTTGGYAVMAVVASCDLPVVAQASPGTQLRFQPITVEEAQAIAARNAHAERELLQTIRTRLAGAR